MALDTRRLTSIADMQAFLDGGDAIRVPTQQDADSGWLACFGAFVIGP